MSATAGLPRHKGTKDIPWRPLGTKKECILYLN